MSPVKLERKIVPKHLLTLNQKWHYYLLGSAKFNVSIQQYLKFTIIEWLGSSLEIRIKDMNYFTVRVCHYHWTAGRWPPDLTFEPPGLTSGPSGLVFYWAIWFGILLAQTDYPVHVMGHLDQIWDQLLNLSIWEITTGLNYCLKHKI